jgi:glycosyltransferase involved in cell wall biosynthesis
VKYQVIIPAYNADGTLEELIRRIRTVVPDTAILVVDDGSTDRTPEIIAKLDVDQIRHQSNRGKGEALKTGFARAIETDADAVIQLDADLQHEPESIPEFREAFGRGEADILIGTRRFDPSIMPLSRRLTNRLTSSIITRMTGAYVADSQSGYRMIARKVIENVHPESSRFDYESEFLIRAIRAGYTVGEVPIKTVYQGEESFIHPLRDTARFIRLMGLFWKD